MKFVWYFRLGWNIAFPTKINKNIFHLMAEFFRNTYKKIEGPVYSSTVSMKCVPSGNVCCLPQNLKQTSTNTFFEKQLS